MTSNATFDMKAHMSLLNERRTKRIEETISGLEKAQAIIPRLLEIAHAGQEPQETNAYRDLMKALESVVIEDTISWEETIQYWEEMTQ